MRINRHDEKLDSLLGKQVRIEFTDGDVRVGTLRWNERMQTPTMLQPQHYFLVPYSGNIVTFRKKHVKKVEEVRVVR